MAAGEAKDALSLKAEVARHERAAPARLDPRLRKQLLELRPNSSSRCKGLARQSVFRPVLYGNSSGVQGWFANCPSRKRELEALPG